MHKGNRSGGSVNHLKQSLQIEKTASAKQLFIKPITEY